MFDVDCFTQKELFFAINPSTMKQGEEDCCFEAQAINKMELLILDALDWRMRSLTPFPYLYFFLSIFQLKDPPLRQALKLRAIEIIFQAQNGANSITVMPLLFTSLQFAFE